jgi:hypothetical protein
MVRNGESWDLGEPELNNRGLPVIHNIAEKLGCIRPSPDMPQAFPEDAVEFAALQAQLFASARDSCDSSEGKQSEDSIFSHFDREDRASSSESEHSSISNEYGQMPWEQQQEPVLTKEMYSPSQQTQPPDPPFGDSSLFIPTSAQFRQELNHTRRSFNPRPISSPPYSDFQNSPVFRSDSPFAAWSGNSDDFLASANMVGMNSLYLRQQQQQRQFQNLPPLDITRQSLSGSYSANMAASLDAARPKDGMTPPSSAASVAAYANIGAYLAASDGTIRPNMLDCDNCNTSADQIDNVMFGDYDSMTIA